MRWWLFALVACGKHGDAPTPPPPAEAGATPTAPPAPTEMPRLEPPTIEPSCDDAGRAYARYQTGGETERKADVDAVRARCERDHWSVKLRNCYVSIIDVDSYQLCADLERREKPPADKPPKLPKPPKPPKKR